MLWIYAGLDLGRCDARARADLPEGCIDLSKTRSAQIANALQTVYEHHRTGHVYLGYLDPLLMLSPPDEILSRKAFRNIVVSVVVSNPLILPLSWKNGLLKLVLVGDRKDNDAPPSETLDNSRSPLV